MNKRLRKRDLAKQGLPLVLTYQDYDEQGRQEVNKMLESVGHGRWAIAVPRSVSVSTVKRSRIMDMPRMLAMERRLRMLEERLAKLEQNTVD